MYTFLDICAQMHKNTCAQKEAYFKGMYTPRLRIFLWANYHYILDHQIVQ